MIPIALSIFDDLAAQSIRRHLLPWPELVSSFMRPQEYASKGACPLFVAGTFGDVPSAKKCLRWDGNLIASSAVIGDIDDSALVVGFNDALARLQRLGVLAMLVTTYRPPRYRIVCPLACPTTDRRALGPFVDSLDAILGGDVCATESWTATQGYYCGRVRGIEYRVATTLGVPLDHCEGLPAITRPAIPAGLPDRGSEVTSYSTSPMHPDSASVISAFNEAHAGEIETLLGACGFAVNGDRILDADEHDIGHLTRDGAHALIHDTNINPRAGPKAKARRFDAFDLYMRHEHGGNYRAAVRAASKELRMNARD